MGLSVWTTVLGAEVSHSRFRIIRCRVVDDSWMDSEAFWDNIRLTEHNTILSP